MKKENDKLDQWIRFHYKIKIAGMVFTGIILVFVLVMYILSRLFGSPDSSSSSSSSSSGGTWGINRPLSENIWKNHDAYKGMILYNGEDGVYLTDQKGVTTTKLHDSIWPFTYHNGWVYVADYVLDGSENYTYAIGVDSGETLIIADKFGMNPKVIDGILYFQDARRIYRVDPQEGNTVFVYQQILEGKSLINYFIAENWLWYSTGSIFNRMHLDTKEIEHNILMDTAHATANHQIKNDQLFFNDRRTGEIYKSDLNLENIDKISSWEAQGTDDPISDLKITEENVYFLGYTENGYNLCRISIQGSEPEVLYSGLAANKIALSEDWDLLFLYSTLKEYAGTETYVYNYRNSEMETISLNEPYYIEIIE